MSRNKPINHGSVGPGKISTFSGPVAPVWLGSRQARYASPSMNYALTALDADDLRRFCHSSTIGYVASDDYSSLRSLAQKTLRYIASQKPVAGILPGCFSSADSSDRSITPELFDALCHHIEQEEGIASYAPWLNVLRTIVFMSYGINLTADQLTNQETAGHSKIIDLKELITSLVDGGVLLEESVNLPDLQAKKILINCHLDGATAPVIFLMRLLGARVYIQPQRPIFLQARYAQLFHALGVSFHAAEGVIPAQDYPHISNLFSHEDPPSDFFITWSCGNCHVLKQVNRSEISTELFIQQTDAKPLDSGLTCQEININAEEFKWRELEGTAEGIIDAAYHYGGVALAMAEELSIAVVVGGKGRLGQQLVYELLLKDPNLSILVVDSSNKQPASVYLTQHQRVTYFSDWGVLNDHLAGALQQADCIKPSSVAVYIALPTSTVLDQQGLTRFAQYMGCRPHLIVGTHQIAGITPDVEEHFILFNDGRMANFCKQRKRPTALRYLDNVFKTVQFAMLYPSENAKLQDWLKKSNAQFDQKDLRKAVSLQSVDTALMTIDRIRQRPGLSPSVLHKIEIASQELEVRLRVAGVNTSALHFSKSTPSADGVFTLMRNVDGLICGILGKGAG